MILGRDFTALLAQRFGGRLRTVTVKHLTPGTRTPGALTSGTNPSEVTYTGDGVLIGYVTERMVDDDVRSGDRLVMLLTGTFTPALPDPEPGDQVTIEDALYEVVKLVGRDADGASYRVAVR